MSHLLGKKEVQENGRSKVLKNVRFWYLSEGFFYLFQEWDCGASTRHSPIFEYATLALVETVVLFETFTLRWRR